MKILAAVCVIFGGAYAGITFFADRKHLEEIALGLEEALLYMQSELQYRKTPFAEIFYELSERTKMPLKLLFFLLAEEIDHRPQVCLEEQMIFAIKKAKKIPREILPLLKTLSRLLGRQGLQEQINGILLVRERLSALRRRCEKENREQGKSYCLIGLCTGIALAIVFI